MEINKWDLGISKIFLRLYIEIYYLLLVLIAEADYTVFQRERVYWPVFYTWLIVPSLRYRGRDLSTVRYNLNLRLCETSILWLGLLALLKLYVMMPLYRWSSKITIIATFMHGASVNLSTSFKGTRFSREKADDNPVIWLSRIVQQTDENIIKAYNVPLSLVPLFPLSFVEASSTLELYHYIVVT